MVVQSTRQGYVYLIKDGYMPVSITAQMLRGHVVRLSCMRPWLTYGIADLASTVFILHSLLKVHSCLLAIDTSCSVVLIVQFSKALS
jgi:hypothetical protein